MRHIKIDASTTLTTEDADSMAGARLGRDSYGLLVQEPARVLRPDGSLLAVLVRDGLPPDVARQGYAALRRIEAFPSNRVTAAGSLKLYPMKEDGTRSRTLRLRPKDYPELAGSSSGVIGYVERVTRFPYCRAAEWVIDNPALWAAAQPFFRAVDGVFAAHVPLRWAAQMAFVRRTHPDFVIEGTSFTTVTVNKNFRTAVHKDAGDLRAGFGVMACLRAGAFSGGHLVIPRYRVAFDLQHGDVLLFDVHEWHCNTALQGKAGTFERVTCVFYYREKMHLCASSAAEQDRAKRRRTGQPLFENAQPHRKGAPADVES